MYRSCPLLLFMPRLVIAFPIRALKCSMVSSHSTQYIDSSSSALCVCCVAVVIVAAGGINYHWICIHVNVCVCEYYAFFFVYLERITSLRVTARQTHIRARRRRRTKNRIVHHRPSSVARIASAATRMCLHITPCAGNVTYTLGNSTNC